MLIPFGVLSAAAFAPVALSDYELISTTVLGTATSSVTFSSLGDYSTTYKHLQVRMLARLTASTGIQNSSFRINGNTGSNYAWHRLGGYGTTTESGAGTSANAMLLGQIATAAQTASVFSPSVIDILDPYSTSKNTTLRSLQGIHGGTNNFVELRSGAFFNTASVTSLSLTVPSDNFAIGSRFSLYGIKG
jgi:hypothetical protein